MPNETLKNRCWTLLNRPAGNIKDSDFCWEEREAIPPGDGEILVRVDWLAFDPAQRTYLDDYESYVPPVAIGEVVRAYGVGTVVESRAPGFAAGDLVQGMFGWQDYAIGAPAHGIIPTTKLPDGTDPKLSLGLLGSTGLAGYFGVTKACQPKPGDVVVISGAAGATGSVAGQVARIAGARVIGIAGGPEKCGWLIDTAGFQAAIDYRNEDVAKRLAELAPDGVDIFFDNVGGPVLEAVISRLALRALIVICGSISGYNEPQPGPNNLINLAFTRSRMQGFLMLDYLDEAPAAIAQLTEWANRGELIGQVDVQTGLENAPATLRRLFEGKNLGKQLLALRG